MTREMAVQVMDLKSSAVRTVVPSKEITDRVVDFDEATVGRLRYECQTVWEDDGMVARMFIHVGVLTREYVALLFDYLRNYLTARILEV